MTKQLYSESGMCMCKTIECTIVNKKIGSIRKLLEIIAKKLEAI